MLMSSNLSGRSFRFNGEVCQSKHFDILLCTFKLVLTWNILFVPSTARSHWPLTSVIVACNVPDLGADLNTFATFDLMCLSLLPSVHLPLFFFRLSLFPPSSFPCRVTGWTGRRWSVRFSLFQTTAVRVWLWLETLWSAPFPPSCRPPPPRSCRWRWDTPAVCRHTFAF